MKIKIWKAIIVFMVFMMAFTIVSRVVTQMRTPTVEVTYAKMGTINKMVQEEAVVQGSSQIAVITEPGIRIQKVAVKSGSYVDEGDLLFTYDVDHLKKNYKKTVNEGNVYAKTSGQIVRVDLEVGREASGSADILIADDADGKHAEIVVDKEYRSYLTVGSIVAVDYTTEMYGESYQTTGDGIVLAIEEDLVEGVLVVTVDLTQLDTNIGDSVYIRVVDVAADYTSVLPREALRYDGSEYFVYVVKEKETIMGLENRISKQKVEVLDMNDNYVAVDKVSTLLPIVLDSDRQLVEDGRVRYAETNE